MIINDKRGVSHTEQDNHVNLLQKKSSIIPNIIKQCTAEAGTSEVNDNNYWKEAHPKSTSAMGSR